MLGVGLMMCNMFVEAKVAPLLTTKYLHTWANSLLPTDTLQVGLTTILSCFCTYTQATAIVKTYSHHFPCCCPPPLMLACCLNICWLPVLLSRPLPATTEGLMALLLPGVKRKGMSSLRPKLLSMSLNQVYIDVVVLNHMQL